MEPGSPLDPFESRLARIARRPKPDVTQSKGRTTDETAFGESASLAGRSDEVEQCELCAAEIPDDHQHLIDVQAQRLLCVCRACAILFDNAVTEGRHYSRVPDTVREIEDFGLADDLWERLGIPVDITFCYTSTLAGRIVAFYPSPAGATESMLQLSAWTEIEALNPVLASMQPNVEALLIDRAHGSRRYMLVPVDACYRLVGIMRTRWRGLSGGDEVWAAIGSFFDDLHNRAERVSREGKRLMQPSQDRASNHRSESIANQSYGAG